MRAASLEEDESEMLLLSEGLLKRGRGLRWPNRRLLFAAILTSGFLGFLCLWSREEESSFSSHPVVISSEPGTQNFSFNGSDVMIFLHIQKTGGTTFGKHLVQDINLESPCSCIKRGSKKKKRKKKKKKLHCECFRPGGDEANRKTWLFSRFSTGWKCGLHADWTELSSCVDKYLTNTEGPAQRRYFYITFLREPLSRYLSEWRHVQRGATWRGSRHVCNGRPATPDEIPSCYEPHDNWEDVSLEEFMDCPSNLAVNRMTRMLADLTLVNCYASPSYSQERDAILLRSAKENLEAMAFFGLTEEQAASQYLFQKAFNLSFRVNFTQNERLQGESTQEELGQEVLQRIRELNHLDVQLYDYAKGLMKKRYRAFKDEEEGDWGEDY
eukprot:TRINITY_DN4954_c0_g1_i1.p1 TRINITY_DN4954_c0_g1~~TRINITY_DN4954_c0_g1_i1.p1  ORF type:complete len:384 (+),score=100.18 TRINITY_DN4954_c0_g1_i1:214-1365(+)